MSTISTTHRIALIGDDLGSSLSPSIHEAEAAAQQLAGYSYEAIDLAGQPERSAELGRVLDTARGAGFTGFNVTHPHKQAIMAHLDELAPVAAALGAVNTVVLHRGRSIGHNTDYTGFRAGLQRSLAKGSSMENVVLIGAGGAGSAVAQALLDLGATTLWIIDTDAAKLESLRLLLEAAKPAGSSACIRTGAPDAAADAIAQADGVVNATPVGMEHIPGTPIDTALLSGTQWVADVIYRPVMTQLLIDAAAKGCRIVDGTTMLIEQAADTFALLTGTEPDRERMRAHLAGLLHERGTVTPGT